MFSSTAIMQKYTIHRLSRTFAALAAISAPALTASEAWAQAPAQFSVYPGALDASGTFVTPLDNPVFKGEVMIQAGEEGERTAEDAWGYTFFELQMLSSCVPEDPFCVAAPTRSDDGVLNVWPSYQGVWNEGQAMPFEAHGLRVGFQSATVELAKYHHEGTLTREGQVSVRLRDDTLVVPLNVVIVKPAAAIAPDLNEYMQGFEDPAYFRALIDDMWDVWPGRITDGDGNLTMIQGDWEARGRESLAEGPTFSYIDPYLGDMFIRPDDVYAQCGIQFRLASVVTVDETDPRGIYFTQSGEQSDPAVLCNDSLSGSGTLKGIFDGWKNRAAEAPSAVLFGAFNQNALTLAFSPYVSNQLCMYKTKGLSTDGLATIGVAAEPVGKNHLVLAHELGHALGMDGDITNGTSTCPNLMCRAIENTHIPGCEIRDGATLAETPFNCAPVPDEVPTPAASCDVARNGARSIASRAGVPIPLEPLSPPRAWSSSDGLLSEVTTLFTEGTASLSADGSGYRVIASPVFRTADWFNVGTKLALDVYVRSGQPNPGWLGSLDVSASVPGATVYNSYLGHRELTGLTQEAWTTLEFEVPEDVRQAFLGDHAGGSIAIAVNTPGGAPGILLDNLRFSGTLADRTVFHGGPQAGGESNPLFSFESVASWAGANATLRSETSLITQGTRSLGVLSNGYAEVISRTFDTTELGGVTSTLTLDVFVPSEQPNPYWYGAIQAYLTCAGAAIHNQYLGEQDLTRLFPDEFNTVAFPALPPNVVTALSAPGNACMLKLALNVNAGSGEYLLDNLSFR